MNATNNNTITKSVPAEIQRNVLMELFTGTLDAFEPRIEFDGFTPIQIVEALKARGVNIISIQNDEAIFDEAPQFILCSEPNSAETVRVLNELADELDLPPFEADFSAIQFNGGRLTSGSIPPFAGAGKVGGGL